MVEAESYKMKKGLKRLSARANAGQVPTLSRKVSFSFSRYGKNVIEQLRRCQVHIEKGLSDEEFERIEALFNFTFPPDLRGVLAAGLPLGDGFPNWRTGGFQQLSLWISKPLYALLAEVESSLFWYRQWGPKPGDSRAALRVAREHMKQVPVLLPVFGNCYVAGSPARAGNPVLFVKGSEAFCCGLDISEFFNSSSFESRGLVRSSAFVPEPVVVTGKCTSLDSDSDYEGQASPGKDALRRISNDSAKSVLSPRSSSGSSFDGSEVQPSKVIEVRSPVRGRRIEFWSDLSERRQVVSCPREDNEFIELHPDTTVDGDGASQCDVVKETVEDVTSRLRRGGWKEEDIAEIVSVTSSCSDYKRGLPDRQTVLEGLAFHLDCLSCSLRQAGWSVHDVADTLSFDTRKMRTRKVSSEFADILAAFVAQA